MASKTTTPASEASATTSAQKSPDLTTWTTAGRNVRFQISEGILFLAVDTRADIVAAAPTTAKGNKTFASTLGNISIPGTAIKLGLNAFTPAV